MTHEGPWRALVPVRAFGSAKSRLRGFGADRVVDDLARRLALRTLTVLDALPEIESILVVTDAAGEDFPRSSKARVLREPCADGLNVAVRRGLAHLAVEAERRGSGTGKTLVLHADLPMLTETDLSEALVRLDAIGRDAFVADDSGTGTTALAWVGPSSRIPCFGADSARRHRAAGFVPLELPRYHGLSADLDTREQLMEYCRSSGRSMIETLFPGIEPASLCTLFGLEQTV